MNNKNRIGLSLLIALAFILPTSGILAGSNSEIAEAGETVTNDIGENIHYIGGDGPIAQALGDVSVLNMVSPELGGPYGHSVKAGTYPIEINLFNEGPGEAQVKTFVDIYEKTVGEEIIMYQTSFEDNFDIYNNWVQIDEDCSLGGYYDSWSWSDARAFTGDHSFKSTMYDIYKGNQDDYLEMTKGLDISDQEGVKVEFYTWVEGDGVEHDYYSYYLPYDWLGFQIGDAGGFVNPYTGMDFMDWNSVPFWLEGSYVFFDTSIGLYSYYYHEDYTPIAEDAGGGWWKVTWEANVADLIAMGFDVTDFRIRFEWHTDPQFQYEGAYVDDVTIISVESFEEKVFQSHSQGPFWIPEGLSSYTFPMEWTAVGDDTKDTCYDVKIWMEVLDPEHESCNDWPNYLDIMVCVEDWFDTEVDNLVIETSIGGTTVIPGDGILEYGEDAHIMADVHLDGTLPAENIPVTCTAKKLTWETIWENDCEGMSPFPETYGDWGLTNKDAFSGSKSFGFFNDDYFEYTEDWAYCGGPRVSFEDVEECYMDFYYKCNMDVGDRLLPCFFDPYMPFVLGMSGGAITGYKSEWVGPMAPASVYARTNLLGGYEYFYGIGFMRDAHGNQVYDVQIGFYLDADDDGVTSHPMADADGVLWSGAFIDDFSISKKVVGEEVWSQTFIIPGPVEPCDTVEVQFEWEDVPYSHYQISVCAQPEGACGNLEDPCETADILVIRDLEKAHWKEIETFDYTSDENGEWGICSSDYNNYLATNADSNNYPDNAHAIVELCIDGEKSVDITGMDLWTTTVDLLDEDFSGGTLPTGWTEWGSDEGGTGDPGWRFWNANSAGGTPPELTLVGNYMSGSSAYVDTEIFDASSLDTCTLEFNSVIWDNGADLGNYDIHVYVYDTINGWTDVTPWPVQVGAGNINIGPGLYVIDLLGEGVALTSNMKVRFRANNVHDLGWTIYDELGKWAIDDVKVWGIINPTETLTVTFDAWWELDDLFDYVFVEFCDDPLAESYLDWNLLDYFTDGSYGLGVDEWATITYNLGTVLLPGTTAFQLRFRLYSDEGWNYRGMMIDNFEIPELDFLDTCDNMDNWCAYPYSLGNFWANPAPGEWCGSFPAGSWGVTVDNALIWSTEINDAYEAYFSWMTDYNFVSGSGKVQVSGDGGENWFTIAEYTGSSGGYVADSYTLTPFVGSDILIRFLAQGEGDWCVKDLLIYGKKDTDAPATAITMQGQMSEAGWYRSAVSVKITATDVGAGMGQIHYILDGKETVVEGALAQFSISANGEHNIEFWGVDKVGNEETPHNTVPTFRIDSGSPPSVQITAPEPGLYLFGNKLLSLSKVFIIGAFTVSATADDDESGVYKVAFYLDGDLVGEDTEVPYSVYCAQKHMGAGTLKVVAEDFSGNSAEDTLDVTYYKFL